MTVLPKPKPYDAREKKMTTRGLKFPKREPLRDAGYRAEVRRERCALLGEGYGACPTRKVDCAHLQGLGRGIKCGDDLTAPLCTGPQGHHRQYDTHTLPKEAREIVKRKAAEIRAKWEARQATRKAR